MLKENHIDRESRSRISKFSYTDVTNNIKLLVVVTPPSIHHDSSTGKMFWEGKFTLVNMKTCGRHTVRKHSEIKNGEQYIALDISLNFGNMEKMKITSSEPKDYLVISCKGLNISLGIKAITRSKNVKRETFAITEVCLKDLSKIIK